jgi:hypothetical protein
MGIIVYGRNLKEKMRTSGLPIFGKEFPAATVMQASE